MSVKQLYRFTAKAGPWVAGYRRDPASPTILLTPEEAGLELLAGTIVPDGTPTGPIVIPGAVAATDRVKAIRGARDWDFTIAELAAFLGLGGVDLGNFAAVLDGLVRKDGEHDLAFQRAATALTEEASIARFRERQASPKFRLGLHSVVTLDGGSIANGEHGFLTPPRQNGAKSLLQIFWDLEAGEVARYGNRPVEFIAELKTTIDFHRAYIGPGGPNDIRLSITPEGMPGGFAAALYLTAQADTYILVLSGTLTGTETQIAANIYVAAGAQPLAADAGVALNQLYWSARDTGGAADVVAEGDLATLADAKAYTDGLARLTAPLDVFNREVVRSKAGEIIARTLAAPKFSCALDPYAVLDGGATYWDGATSVGATETSGGVRIQAGQHGRNAQMRARFTLSAQEVGPRAGRPVRFVAVYRTSGGVLARIVDNLGNSQLSLVLEGSPRTATLRAYETQADLLTIEADLYLVGSERQIAVVAQVAGASVVLAADLTLQLLSSEWFPIDPGGASDVLDTRFSPLVSSVGELVAATLPRRQLDGGAIAGYADRGVVIPVGNSGAGTLYVAGLPLTGLIAGTEYQVWFRFQASSNLSPGTNLYAYGATVAYPGGNEVTAQTFVLRRLAIDVFEGSLTHVAMGGEERCDFFLGIGASAVRSTEAFVVLKQAGLIIRSTAVPTTITAQIQRTVEGYRTLLAHKPDRREFVTVASDFTLDFGRVRDGATAMRRAASADERNEVRVTPGIYADECSPGVFIDPADWVDLVGTGGARDVRIVARFPSNQLLQSEIQPVFWKMSGRIANASFDVEQVRYGIHIEGGNSRARAIQVLESIEINHRGATGWPAPTAVGVGQHEGNHLTVINSWLASTTNALGVHNNTGWTRRAKVTVRGSYLFARGVDGQAISASSTGAGVKSPVEVEDVCFGGGGHIRLDNFFLPGSPLSAHTADRAEYPVTVRSSTGVDWVKLNDVPCLALTSVPGSTSAVAVSNTGALILFGAAPDVREGAADYAGRVYSHQAYGVLTGEQDPGVTAAARWGDRRSFPLPLDVAFDGGAPVRLMIDADYRGMSDDAVIASLNTKLAAARGGSAGGAFFSFEKPYVNRGSVRQPAREGWAENAGTVTIRKGQQLAYVGVDVRLFTSSDGIEAYAGVALNDAIPRARVHFQFSGRIGQGHLAFDGTPSAVFGDLFGVGPTPGALTKGTARPLLRVLFSAARGLVFEIIGARAGLVSAEIVDASAPGRSVLTGTAAQGATALGLGTGNAPTFAGVNLTAPLSLAGVPTLTNVGGFTVLKDGSGTVNALVLGSADPTNYHKATSHYFQSRNGASTYAFIDPTGLTANVPVRPPAYTVATLPLPGTAGRTAWASNGRAYNGVGALQSAGAGTGVLVSDDGAAWRVAGTNQTVQA